METIKVKFSKKFKQITIFFEHSISKKFEDLKHIFPSKKNARKFIDQINGLEQFLSIILSTNLQWIVMLILQKSLKKTR